MKKPARPAIPRKRIYRLASYLRCLARLRANSSFSVSNDALAKAAGVESTQLRKELAYLGTFGTRGLGYDVGELWCRIGDELGTSRLQPVISGGVGNLGLALLSYRGFEREGFEIVAAFDLEPRRPRGRTIQGTVGSLDALPGFLHESRVQLAILTAPAEAAQTVVNQLIAGDVMGILNSSPIVLHVPEEVRVNNVNLAIKLESLSYVI